MHIVDCYTKDSAHHDKVLIAAGKLLNRDEFPKFIATVGGPIIEQMLPKNSNKISAEIQFCISVPTNHLSLISRYTKEFVKHINDQKVGLYVIRLFACLGEGEVRKYEDTLIALLSKKETLDAVAVVIPFIADKLKDTAVLLPLLSSSIVLPERFAMFLVDLFPQNEMPQIITALLPAELNSPLEKPLCQIQNRMYVILTTPEMLVPELILAVSNLLVSMWMAYQKDVMQFVADTKLVEFFRGILPELEEISQHIFILGVSPVMDDIPASKPLKKQANTGLKQSEFVFNEDDLQQ